MFEENMLLYGQYWGERILTRPDTFYDSAYVFYQIADYTQDPSWEVFAETSRELYKTFLTNNTAIQGFWRFPHGLFEAHLRGDPTALDFLRQTRDKQNLTRPDTKGVDQVQLWISSEYARPISYALQANVLCERAGDPRQARVSNPDFNPSLPVSISNRPGLLEILLGHTESWLTGNDFNPEYNFLQPFMIGLASMALIEYHEWTPDPRIPGIVKSLLDLIWNQCWVSDVGGTPGNYNDLGGSGFGAFRYVVPPVAFEGNDQPAPPVSNLIAPAYAWYYKESGLIEYRDKADLIFEGCVSLTDLSNQAKIFTQHFRYAFNYLRWRMASYTELFSIWNDNQLLERVMIAVGVAAQTVMLESGATTNHANRMIWAKQAFSNPKEEARKFVMSALAANKDATVTNILAASDIALQNNVDSAIDVMAGI